MVPFQDFLPLSTEVLPLETLSAHSSHWKEEAKQGSILPETFPTLGGGGTQMWKRSGQNSEPHPVRTHFLLQCVWLSE